MFKGKLLTVSEFISQRLNDCAATCPLCKESLHVSAYCSIKKTASFDHYPSKPNEIEKPKCALSYSDHPIYRLLEKEGRDESLAVQLRTSFFTEKNLRCAFSFLVAATGHGCMTAGIFEMLCRKADILEIWTLKKMPLWAIPFILLAISDFLVKRKGHDDQELPPYAIRFVVHKPSRSQLNKTWLSPGDCRLVKYFLKNNGKPGNAFTSKLWSSSFVFSEEIYKEHSDDSWFNYGLAEKIRDIVKQQT